MIVVHHGIFWFKSNPSFKGYLKKRISLLLENGISLYAAHLPLDKHPTVGNNAQLLKLLGFEPDLTRPFAYYSGMYLGFIGTRTTATTCERIAQTLTQSTGARCTILNFGPRDIRTIAVCSGGGGYAQLEEAAASGVDVYVTGDASESYHAAKDRGLNLIFAGHHATETVGVKALAHVVKRELGVETVFVDVPTGL